MSINIRADDNLCGVSCDVVNCLYLGTDNHCHAQKINVESTNAVRKAETFCGTFVAKG